MVIIVDPDGVLWGKGSISFSIVLMSVERYTLSLSGGSMMNVFGIV